MDTEKSETKMMLPPPNFAKKPTEPPPQVLPHFLTPSGMTLLPSDKQPPPMYGARGATVPGKFLPPHKRQGKQQEKRAQTAKDETAFCEACEMELQSQEDFRHHRRQHERCPVDGCKYQGHPSVMDKHVTVLHSTGLYDRFKKLASPEEIAAWREERRKRYPTTAQVEQRRLAQEQRQRRGERLGTNKKAFGHPEDRKRAAATGERTWNPDHKQRGKRPNKRQQQKRDYRDKRREASGQTKPAEGPIKEDTITERVVAPPPPKAASPPKVEAAEDDPFFGRTTSAPCSSGLASLLGAYGSESEEDEEPVPAVTQAAADKSNCDLKRKSTDEDLKEQCHVVDKKPKMEPSKPAALVETDAIHANDKVASPVRDTTSDDEPPDETPIERTCALPSPPRPAEMPSTSAKPKKPVPPPRRRIQSGLDLRKAQLRRQNTMLEKLLEAEIRHERNLLLQCVRFVCENNFFRVEPEKNTQATTNVS